MSAWRRHGTGLNQHAGPYAGFETGYIRATLPPASPAAVPHGDEHGGGDRSDGACNPGSNITINHRGDLSCMGR